MKPNDKAIEAARKVVIQRATHNLFNPSFLFGVIEAALDAAYAAQFQSGDYAGLIRELRMRPHRRGYETEDEAKERRQKEREASADAIEAVLAERDALKAELASGHMWIQMRATVLEELAMVRAERDALAARLAPVDDEALVEICAKGIASSKTNGYEAWMQESRVAIAAIRPHIEAAEREWCAKRILETNWVDADPEDIAAAIRSGK